MMGEEKQRTPDLFHFMLFYVVSMVVEVVNDSEDILFSNIKFQGY